MATRFTFPPTCRPRVTIAGAEYDRDIYLPRVLPIGPQEIGDVSIEGRKRVLCRLAKALRAERTRGRAGHWTYDLNRHLALARALTAERRLLAAVVKSTYT